MKFDAEQFCTDFNIPFWTEGKNVTMGWVNVTCPFCGDHSNHGGFNPDKGYYHCWNCKWHSLPEVLKELTGGNWPETYAILDQYSNTGRYHLQKKEKIKPPESISLPLGTGPLSPRHKQYLERRGFDPDRLEREFDLKGTGHLGPYKFRIIAPIYFHGELVSYQGRDITDQQTERYKGCKKSDELIHHKNILYNIDRVPGDTCVVVEGITDAWRLGAGAVATFGTTFTIPQVYLLAERFKRIIIVFDPEEGAQMMADQLAYQLQSLGRDTLIFEIDRDDPGSLSDDEAKQLMKEALG